MKLGKNWLKLFIAINLLGALYGFNFFYGQQLLDALTMPWLLPFIPDCPLFALLLGLALIFVLQGKKKDCFYFFAFAGSVKYSLWTMAVLLGFSSHYLGQDFWLYTLLFVGHAGLLAESLILLGRFKFQKKFLLFTLGFFLLNDFSDYFLASHPPLPEGVLPEMLVFTLGLSLITVALTVWLALKMKKKIIIIE